MNMWGFRPSVFDALAAAVAELGAHDPDVEVFLPDVVAAAMRTAETDSASSGRTGVHPVSPTKDVDAVRAAQS